MSQNPGMAQALLQQVAGSNPALLQQLGENPEQVLQQILGSSADDENDEEGNVPPGAQVVNVTVEERAAIQRVRLRCVGGSQSYGFTLITAGRARIHPAASRRSLLCV